MSRKEKSSGERRFRVAPDAATEVVGERASSTGVLLFSAVLFVAVLAAVLGIGWLTVGRVTLEVIVVAALAALLAIGCCHVAQQWERVVVLRLGRFNRVSGPGLFWTIPVIESNTMRVDTRTRVTTFYAEETLTADLVPMNVDAVLFWHVWDAAAACTEVGDFTRAVEMAAQTALRDAIGRASAAEVAIRREQLDRELKRVLEEKVAPWGVTILSVEVRDILLPKELQEAMAMEAVAERKKNARMVLAEAEKDISEMLKDASEVYAGDQDAMKLRTMHLAYESVEQSGGTLVIPSAFSEGFAPNGQEASRQSE